MSDRACGDCRVCCILPEVVEVGKVRGVPCQHLSMEPGCRAACGIYADRPEPCKVFRCLWLQGHGPAWGKPSKVGLMLTGHESEGGGFHIQAWETTPGASKKKKARAMLSKLRAPFVVVGVER